MERQMDTEKSLCDELRNYCTANNLPYLSADELLVELLSVDVRNEANIAWVRDFIRRWNAWENAEIDPMDA
jgi:hypothetical protein